MVRRSEAFLKTFIVFHAYSVFIKELISNEVRVFISYRTINSNNSHSNHFSDSTLYIRDHTRYFIYM